MIILPLSQGKSAIISPEDADLAVPKWSMISPGGFQYAARRKRVSESEAGKCIYLHRLIAARIGRLRKGFVVDHMNGDTLDNQRSNLRIIPKAENHRNTAGPRSNNTSGYLGVFYRKDRHCWKAEIKTNGKSRFVGLFKTAEEAHRARLAAERECWGIQPRRAAAHGEA